MWASNGFILEALTSKSQQTWNSFAWLQTWPDMDQQIPNIINVVNHNDGLASASLNTVTKFFEQIKAVDDLQLQRREMFKMLMEKVPTQGKKGNYFDNGFTFFQDIGKQVGKKPQYR